MHTIFWLENEYEYLGVDGRIILEWILGKWHEKDKIMFIWLRIVTGVGLF
jgi:hypothetical protein